MNQYINTISGTVPCRKGSTHLSMATGGRNLI